MSRFRNSGLCQRHMLEHPPSRKASCHRQHAGATNNNSKARMMVQSLLNVLHSLHHHCSQSQRLITTLEQKQDQFLMNWSCFCCPAVTYSPIGVAPSVPSAWEGLTSVFGMGTGGTLPLSPPDYSIVKLKVLTFTLKIA